MLKTIRSAVTILAVAYRRFTSSQFHHLALRTSSNQESSAAFSAVWSLWPARDWRNSRNVRRAITRMTELYYVPILGTSSRERLPATTKLVNLSPPAKWLDSFRTPGFQHVERGARAGSGKPY